MLLLVHLVRMIFVKVQGITNGLRCFAEVPRLPARTNPRHLEIHTAVVMATSILLPRLFLLIFGVLSTNVLGHFMNYGHYAPRAPGTLLLNMLIKDEAGHLDRVLPKWAKIIDYWIIGVDDQNTDDSPEIIMKHLSHIPGEIVIVNFDGMGPTWTKLVEHGIEHYPNATHGIVADADFMPMQDTLDKFQLDTRCSKHMYTIYTEDHQHNRKMDWIYRNIPGARVNRRVHQTVEVPELPNQEVFQTLIDLNIEERTGGYQDRSGNKMKRYIEWLEKDLVDWGEDDTRTLYYLGYSNFDIFLNNKGKTRFCNYPMIYDD